MMNQISRVTIVVLAAGLLCAGLLFGAAASAADRSACTADIEKFCSNIKPGILPLMDCLEKNENQLSAACKEFEATMGGKKVEKAERVKEKAKFRRACMNDMAKFCKDANPMQGGMLKCLNDNAKEISVSCSQSVKALMN